MFLGGAYTGSSSSRLVTDSYKAGVIGSIPILPTADVNVDSHMKLYNRDKCD